MAELENPSAGKFGPPPENEQRERVRQDGPKKPKSRWPLVLLAILALQYFFDSLRGWGADLAVLLLAIAGYVAEFIFYRQEQAANGGPDPYTPPTHLTR